MTRAKALAFARKAKRLIPDATIEGYPHLRIRDVTADKLADFYQWAAMTGFGASSWPPPTSASGSETEQP